MDVNIYCLRDGDRIVNALGLFQEIGDDYSGLLRMIDEYGFIKEPSAFLNALRKVRDKMSRLSVLVEQSTDEMGNLARELLKPVKPQPVKPQQPTEEEKAIHETIQMAKESGFKNGDTAWMLCNLKPTKVKIVDAGCMKVKVLDGKTGTVFACKLYKGREAARIDARKLRNAKNEA